MENVKMKLNRLNRKDISTKAALDLNITIEDADIIVRTWFEELSNALINNNEVSIPNVGIFTPYRTPERKGTGALEGKGVLGNQRSLKFKPSTKIVDDMRKEDRGI